MSAQSATSVPAVRRPVERRNTATSTRRVAPRPRARVRREVAAATQPAPRAPFLVLVVVLLGGGLLGLLALNTVLAQGSFRVSDLQRRVAALDDQQQALQQRVALRAAPQRLARRASALGMVPMLEPAFLRAGDGRVLGRPQPAAGGSSPDVAAQRPAPTFSGTGGGAAVAGPDDVRTTPALAPTGPTGLGAGVAAPGGTGPARHLGDPGAADHTQGQPSGQDQTRGRHPAGQPREASRP